MTFFFLREAFYGLEYAKMRLRPGLSRLAEDTPSKSSHYEKKTESIDAVPEYGLEYAENAFVKRQKTIVGSVVLSCC